uniref:NADH-ubiquinone oxidoreductase chain 1 n=1 Tax=Antrokoreana gracilipes TaxID=364406 RepID=A9X4J0_ANTGC|nr:NADH dehydrogenase subunit 1 [Antrokoreana gracilipes]ABC55890.1 NADH dehydrogenase subunit 1 [Antrokoreana gracilipes]
MWVVLVVNYACLIVLVLVAVAFFTLLERSILGYVQIRKGPNKVGFGGIFQPFADAVKLFVKESVSPLQANSVIFFICPGAMLLITLVLWVSAPFLFGGLDFKLGLLFFLCCVSLNVYTLFGCGWGSNSKYALLGALRGVAQTISYEVSLALVLLSAVCLTSSYNLKIFTSYQESIWFICIMAPLTGVWMVSMLAETNRTPFDFAEGESELVSGFNVEYSSGLFALLFMSEYASMMFMSCVTSILYFGGLTMASMGMSWAIIFLFVWVRGTLPRFRYDKLMYMAWSSYLPVALSYLLFFSGVLVMIMW